MNRKLYFLYHLIVKHDVLGIGLKKYGHIGSSTIIFKPITTDRNKKFIHIGNNVTIGKYARINCYPNWGGTNIPQIIIGDGCNIGQRLTLLAGGKICIGQGVLMASDILVTSENHSTNPEMDMLYMDQPIICADVNIKDGCWIGEKVVIVPGVTIGKYSVIGAGSIVTKDIPDYCIAVGNPARVIKKYSFVKHRWEKMKFEV